MQAELTRVAEIDGLFDRVEQTFAGLDILVNNAAIFSPTPVGQTTEAQWDAVLDTNLKAQFFAAQRAAPLLARSGRGRIVNFASLGGLLAWPTYTAYSVSKAGVIMLTRTLARALAPAITVNAIAPGTISFPGDAPAIAERATRSAPMQRPGSANDITDAVHLPHRRRIRHRPSPRRRWRLVHPVLNFAWHRLKFRPAPTPQSRRRSAAKKS